MSRRSQVSARNSMGASFVIVISNQDSTSSRLLPGSSYQLFVIRTLLEVCEARWGECIRSQRSIEQHTNSVVPL
jgi:hypothetical protein